MWKNSRYTFPFIILILLLVLQPLLAQEAEPTPTSEESWLRLPDMPDTATQADYGAEIYRLVCRDCHGDVGQGLTDEWRATGFSPDDQNCWQAKCHSGSHPIEGFVLPKYIPPVAGGESLSRFNTSLDLFHFMRAAMPYHNPGSLLDREYWQLTAFILEMREEQPLDVVLDEATAVKHLLHPNKPAPEPTAVIPPSPTPQQPMTTATETWQWGFLGLLAVMGAGTAVLLWQRR